MSLKIESTRTPPVTSQRASSAGNTTTGAASGRTAVAGTDSVQLTGHARLAQDLAGLLADAPSVDARRVAATRAALDSGEYRVDPQLTAAKLLRFEWELQTS